MDESEQEKLVEKREASTFALPRGSSNYRTPADFRVGLDAIYHFDDWDPCPFNETGIREMDGLCSTPDWVKRYFYNPPYDHVVPWLKESLRDWRRGILSCALIKADMPTNWMHDWVFSYARVIWVRSRIKFKGPKLPGAAFNSAAAVYEPGKKSLPQSVMWKEAARVWHVLFKARAPLDHGARSSLSCCDAVATYLIRDRRRVLAAGHPCFCCWGPLPRLLRTFGRTLRCPAR